MPIAYYHRDNVPEDVRRAAGEALPCVLARLGREYVLLLGPEALARCDGKVSDFKGRLRYNANLHGLMLPPSHPSLRARSTCGDSPPRHEEHQWYAHQHQSPDLLRSGMRRMVTGKGALCVSFVPLW